MLTSLGRRPKTGKNGLVRISKAEYKLLWPYAVVRAIRALFQDLAGHHVSQRRRHKTFTNPNISNITSLALGPLGLDMVGPEGK